MAERVIKEEPQEVKEEEAEDEREEGMPAPPSPPRKRRCGGGGSEARRGGRGGERPPPFEMVVVKEEPTAAPVPAEDVNLPAAVMPVVDPVSEIIVVDPLTTPESASPSQQIPTDPAGVPSMGSEAKRLTSSGGKILENILVRPKKDLPVRVVTSSEVPASRAGGNILESLLCKSKGQPVEGPAADSTEPRLVMSEEHLDNPEVVDLSSAGKTSPTVSAANTSQSSSADCFVGHKRKYGMISRASSYNESSSKQVTTTIRGTLKNILSESGERSQAASLTDSSEAPLIGSKDLAKDISPGDQSKDLAKGVGPDDQSKDLAKDIGPDDQSKDLAKDVGIHDQCKGLAKDVSPSDQSKDHAKDVGPGDQSEDLAKDVCPGDQSKDLAKDVRPGDQSKDLAKDVRPGDQTLEGDRIAESEVLASANGPSQKETPENGVACPDDQFAAHSPDHSSKESVTESKTQSETDLDEHSSSGFSDSLEEESDFVPFDSSDQQSQEATQPSATNQPDPEEEPDSDEEPLSGRLAVLKQQSFICRVCNTNFPLKSALEGHVCSNLFTCRHCRSVFNTQRSLEQHMDTVHPPPASAPSELKLAAPNQSSNVPSLKIHFICDSCGQNFDTKAKLDCHSLKHVRRRTNQYSRPHFYCKKCPLSFTRESNLNQHIEAVHVEKRPFVCTACGTDYPALKYLVWHALTHRPLMHCGVCDVKFPNKQVFIDHMAQVHEKELPLLCRHCGRPFQRKANLTKHEEKHAAWFEKFREKTGQQVNEKLCEKTGEQVKKTKETQQTKNVVDVGDNEKKHECKDCGRKFCFREALQFHVKKVHRPTEAVPERRKKRVVVKRKKTPEVKKIHSGDTFNCPVCDEKYSAFSTDREQEHREECRREGEEVPNSVEVNKGDTGENARINEEEEEECNDDTEPVLCTLCGDMFVDVIALQMHTEDEHGEKMQVDAKVCRKRRRKQNPLECVKCWRWFGSETMLEIHMENAHVVKIKKEEEQYQLCGECGGIFLSDELLEKHVHNVHSGREQRELVCVECGEVFMDETMLEIHKESVHVVITL